MRQAGWMMRSLAVLAAVWLVAACLVASAAEARGLPRQAGGDDWATYSHPTGGSFRHPAGWQVIEQPGGLMIVPDDADFGREWITVFGGPVQGVGAADSPAVVTYLDQAMQQLAPTSRRTGQPRAIPRQAGSAAAYQYSFTHPQTQQVAWVNLYVITLPDAVVAFSHTADATRVASRSPVLTQMAASFNHTPAQGPQANAQHGGIAQPAAGPTDPKLLGTWRGENLYHGHGVISNAHTRWTFHPDGTITSGTQGGVNVDVRNRDGQSVGGATGTNQGGASGTWTASNGRLTIRWADGGTTQRNYRVVGKYIEFRDANGELYDFMER